MKLTPEETNLLVDVVLGNHLVTEIEKSATEFRVHFNWYGGHAVGSRALVYNLRASILETTAEIKKLERLLWLPQGNHEISKFNDI